MKRLAILLLAAVAVVAQAQQGAPRDVPKDHWAFEAVDTLFRNGLLKGYPDGTFKGSRPLSRYELAAVLAGLNRNLKERLDSIDAGTTKATPQERSELMAQLKSLRGEVDAMLLMRTELSDLTQKMNSMRDQLGSIRKDLDGIRKDTERIKG